MNDEKVQEYKEKYPNMPYDEVVKLAGKEPKKQMGSPGFIGRNPSDLLKSNEYNWSDISKLSQPERLEMRRKHQAGEIKISFDQ